jgi:hypothetical protein
MPLGGSSPGTNGYTLSSLSVFEGWTDHASFNDQHYIITTSTDGTNYTYLYSINYMPFLAANDLDNAGDQDASTLVTLSNMNVTGVKFIQLTLTAGVDGGGQLQEGQLLQEVEVFGTQTAAVPPKPVITNVKTSGNSLILSGTNGVADAGYYVLASTNVAIPLTNWTVIGTNTFDGSGNFNITNSVNPGVPKRFYLLKLQ